MSPSPTRIFWTSEQPVYFIQSDSSFKSLLRVNYKLIPQKGWLPSTAFGVDFTSLVFPSEVDFISKHRFEVWRLIYRKKSRTVDFCRFSFFCWCKPASEVEGIKGKLFLRWEAIISSCIPGCSILHCVLVISIVSKFSYAFFSKKKKNFQFPTSRRYISVMVASRDSNEGSF